MAAPTEFTLESVRQFMLAREGRVTNHELVKHFKAWLTHPIEKDSARQRFKEYVNTLASIRQEDGEKYLVLKKRFFPNFEEDAALSSRGYSQDSGLGGLGPSLLDEVMSSYQSSAAQTPAMAMSAHHSQRRLLPPTPSSPPTHFRPAVPPPPPDLGLPLGPSHAQFYPPGPPSLQAQRNSFSSLHHRNSFAGGDPAQYGDPMMVRAPPPYRAPPTNNTAYRQLPPPPPPPSKSPYDVGLPLPPSDYGLPIPNRSSMNAYAPHQPNAHPDPYGHPDFNGVPPPVPRRHVDYHHPQPSRSSSAASLHQAPYGGQRAPPPPPPKEIVVSSPPPPPVPNRSHNQLPGLGDSQLSLATSSNGNLSRQTSSEEKENNSPSSELDGVFEAHSAAPNETISVKERTKTFNRMASESDLGKQQAKQNRHQQSMAGSRKTSNSSVRRRNSRASRASSTGPREDKSDDSSSINTIDQSSKTWMVSALNSFHCLLWTVLSRYMHP
jgi:hypothetical protein